MTLLGLPWWAWIPTTLSAWILDMTIAVVGQLARHRHQLTCRVYWQLRLIAQTVAVACTFILTFAVWGPVIGAAFNGWDIVWGAVTGWRAWRHKQPVPARIHTLPHPELGNVTVIQYHYLVGTVREVWRHREHDDDCEHGPTKRWFGATAKLQPWRKVALRPDFTPA